MLMEEKIEQNVSNVPILRQLKDMAVGDIVVFPMKQIYNIRVYCTNLKQTTGREYQTRIKRPENIYEVERVS